MAARNWVIYERARELYAQLRNHSAVLKTLIQEGKAVSYSTLLKWYKTDQKEWDQIADERDGKVKEKATEPIEEEMLNRLLNVVRGLLDRIEKQMKDENKGPVDAQTLYSLNGSLDKLLTWKKAYESKTSDNSAKDSVVMEVLMGHHAIGPLLIEFNNEIVREIDRRLKKT